MLQVWKYDLEPGAFTCEMPRGAKLLTAQTQLVPIQVAVDARRTSHGVVERCS